MVEDVAPRIGVRGLKSTARLKEVTAFRRTSYWGAWIEIKENRCLYSHSDCRTSYWGAWIEIFKIVPIEVTISVAPRIGVRGLK